VARRIEPPITDLSKLPTPLTQGEKLFFEFLNRNLPEEWEIYVQPPLNGFRPDFVVLHPEVGVGIFEVKDWDLSLYSARNGEIRVRNASGLVRVRNPLNQLLLYENQTFEMLAPSLGLERARDRRAHACVHVGLVFPCAKDSKAKRLMHRVMSKEQQQYISVVGRKTLRNNKIALVLPDHDRKSSHFFGPGTANELRCWIAEPDSDRDQRYPLKLTKQQRRLVLGRTSSGHRRIKGPAGSGKSQVIGARAAQLAMEGKRVLVLSFNITMVTFLRDIAVRYKHPDARSAVRKNIRFSWFHRWCQELIIQFGGPGAWAELWQQNKDEDYVLQILVPRRVAELATQKGPKDLFDAILVDEGQDWLQPWLSVLRLFLVENGEMVLVADETQDIYKRTDSWTEKRGKGWVRLEGSHRLHGDMIPMLSRFLRKFCQGTKIDLPEPAQGELAVEPLQLTWMEVSCHHQPWVITHAILRQIESSKNPFPITDITILLEDHEDGLELVQGLESQGRDIAHVFAETKVEQRLLKIKFHNGVGKLKACTIHSFKGWEQRGVILILRGINSEQSFRLLYTALSRVKRSTRGSFLLVISYVPELRDFFDEDNGFKQHILR
jgi:hypothetical protein